MYYGEGIPNVKHMVGLNETSHMAQPVEKPLRLFPDTQDLIEVEPRKLIGLDRLPLPGAHQAQRPLSPTHLQSFLQSDPQRWPPVLVTRTDKGLLLIDGYHRREAAKRLSLPTISATIRAFDSLEAVVEAAFQAHLAHGLPPSQHPFDATPSGPLFSIETHAFSLVALS